MNCNKLILSDELPSSYTYQSYSEDSKSKESYRSSIISGDEQPVRFWNSPRFDSLSSSSLDSVDLSTQPPSPQDLREFLGYSPSESCLASPRSPKLSPECIARTQALIQNQLKVTKLDLATAFQKKDWNEICVVHHDTPRYETQKPLPNTIKKTRHSWMCSFGDDDD